MVVGVVGGGLFGVTTALSLDNAGFDVELYEQANEIMQAASWANQWRLHRGYHYPRAPPTARSCRDSSTRFTERFSDAVIETSDHYYCIADDDRTKTTGDEYLSFCDQLDLSYERTHPDVVDEDKIDISVQVPENRIDPHALKSQCEQELGASDVTVNLDERVTDLDEYRHEYTVVATYAGINTLLAGHTSLYERYKFELCEKPVVRLPSRFDNTSVVVLDGPFMCFDPYGRTGKFLLGNVVHATHETTIGDRPSFDDRYDHLLDSGLIESPDITKFDKFVESGKDFIPGLAEAEHIGSLYTTRTVLAGVEDTDERPTIVERDGDVFKIFSGKLATCVDAAEQVTSELVSKQDSL